MTFTRLSLSAPARKRVRAITLSAAAIAGVAMPTLAQAATIGSTHTPTQQAQSVSGRDGNTATATNASDSSSSSSASDTTSYTVVAGDTLFGIAKSKLGNGDDYHKLWDLNKDRSEPGGTFTNQDLIEIGWTISVPAAGASSATTDGSATTSTTGTDTASAGADQSSTAAGASTDSSTTASTDSSSSSSSSSTTYADNLDGWINQAISILSAHGYSVSYNAIYQTAMNESSGNPSATNGWDSNAAAGTPSIGLMQMIQPTFDAYALSGYNDIYNPVDNIIASVIYAQATYGGLDNVVAARCDGSCWYGY